MTKQVLLINITRMGDLVQMGSLLVRLQHEWPGAEVDLVVDRRFAPVAELLPHLRHVVTYDFHALVDDTRSHTKDVVTLYREVAAWALPLRQVQYDRIVNLTFNRQSAFLASYIGAPDIRGVGAAPDGRVTIQNPWMAYLTDMHRYRRFNRFNLVDIYAWGGSGPGPFAPLSVEVPPESAEWAKCFLSQQAPARVHIAAQVGASDPMKAWRPAYYGRTLAAITKRIDADVILIGTPQEQESIQEAKRAYREAGGKGAWVEAAGRTDLKQLVAVLAQCRLLLTNDTGPMHLAVGVGIPVVDLSVGHVDFQETGPYGPGHWVVQPDLGCAPCGFDQVCLHHACKDRLIPDEIADLCLHVLKAAPFPHLSHSIRVYESAVDRDGLAAFRLRSGHEKPLASWYGSFWRQAWFGEFTGLAGAEPAPEEAPPDREAALGTLEELKRIAERLVHNALNVARLSRRHPVPVAALKSAQAEELKARNEAIPLGLQSPAANPLMVALVRDLHNDDGLTLAAMAQARVETYRRWQRRLHSVTTRIRSMTSQSGLIRPQPQLIRNAEAV